VDVEVDSLHVKRIAVEDLVSYVYIVIVDLSKDKAYSCKTSHWVTSLFCQVIKIVCWIPEKVHKCVNFYSDW
jgi:hypothetical protein